MPAVFTQIFVDNAHDPLGWNDRDKAFAEIYEDQRGVNPRYIIPFYLIQIDPDGVINNISVEYAEYAAERDKELIN